MYNIVMIGPQGSGKGTQSEKLSDKLGIPYVSVGQLFREEIERGTGLGKAVAEYVKKGDMAPDDLVDQLMVGRLEEEDTANGIILDGFPRDQKQAEALDKLMDDLGRQVTHVVYLELSDQEAVRRLSGRRVCSDPHCGLNYHVDFNPPKKDPDKCDRCGQPLKQREDDVPEAIQHRLQLFHQGTRPLIDFFKERGILYPIDGDQSIEEVEKSIYAALGI